MKQKLDVKNSKLTFFHGIKIVVVEQFLLEVNEKIISPDGVDECASPYHRLVVARAFEST
jgi:hypothetical protein